MIAIVDTRVGNLGSIRNMLKNCGVRSKITKSKEDIINASKLILPGVGSFDGGMNALKKYDLIGPLNESVLEKRASVLGICLGMQLMGDSSDEGNEAGLGWIKGKVRKLEPSKELKVPHMSWNYVTSLHNDFFSAFHEDRFYFAHSYHFCCNNEENIALTTSYGKEVIAAIKHDNIFGVQFHPEKSHRFGKKLFTAFSNEKI